MRESGTLSSDAAGHESTLHRAAAHNTRAPSCAAFVRGTLRLTPQRLRGLYPIMRFPDVPVVETVLLDEPDVASEGLGEVATDPAPAVVGNAVFHAAGIRLRQVPFTPARVKTALART